LNSLGISTLLTRSPTPLRVRSSSSTTLRSLSMSASLKLTPWAQSSRMVKALSMFSCLSVGTGNTYIVWS